LDDLLAKYMELEQKILERKKDIESMKKSEGKN